MRGVRKHCPNINFDDLEQSIGIGNANIQAERLRSLLNQRLQQMVRVNPRRIDLVNRLEELVDTHNEASANNAAYPEELIAFARNVRTEEQRASREGLSEEELAIADLLITEYESAAGDWERVKVIARELLAELKRSGRMINNWYSKQDMRSGVRTIIFSVLDTLPDSYARERYQQKVEEVYRYVRAYYEDYSGGDGPISE